MVWYMIWFWFRSNNYTNKTPNTALRAFIWPKLCLDFIKLSRNSFGDLVGTDSSTGLKIKPHDVIFKVLSISLSKKYFRRYSQRNYFDMRSEMSLCKINIIFDRPLLLLWNVYENKAPCEWKKVKKPDCMAEF